MTPALTPRREFWLLVTLAGIQFTHILDFMIMMPLGPQFTALFGIMIMKSRIWVNWMPASVNSSQSSRRRDRVPDAPAEGWVCKGRPWGQ